GPRRRPSEAVRKRGSADVATRPASGHMSRGNRLMQPSAPVAENSPANAAPKPSGFRADIQGLRALAVGIVLLYHLWPDRFNGGFVGVDVFFVISGFLITSHLINTPPRSWSDIARFWARRIRRLLPASLLVLFVVGIATFLVAP